MDVAVKTVVFSTDNPNKRAVLKEAALCQSISRERRRVWGLGWGLGFGSDCLQGLHRGWSAVLRLVCPYPHTPFGRCPDIGRRP